MSATVDEMKRPEGAQQDGKRPEGTEQEGKDGVVLEDGSELIEAEKFQVRMGIGRTCFHKWRDEGRLVHLKHYIKVRGRVWVFWSKQLLLDISDPETRVNKMERVHKRRSPNPGNRRSRAIDLSA